MEITEFETLITKSIDKWLETGILIDGKFGISFFNNKLIHSTRIYSKCACAISTLIDEGEECTVKELSIYDQKFANGETTYIPNVDPIEFISNKIKVDQGCLKSFVIGFDGLPNNPIDSELEKYYELGLKIRNKYLENIK